MDLVIAHVSKDYGRGPVLRDVSLTVRQGETVCLMGPSGLGKTTLLRCIAGLETPDAGAVTGVPRRLGYVFQEDRLCDNFSAVANIRLVTGRTLPEKAILQHLEELGLSDSVRLPVSQLSGGMRRRVAIARAVCCGPERRRAMTCCGWKTASRRVRSQTSSRGSRVSRGRRWSGPSAARRRWSTSSSRGSSTSSPAA